jgi:hypothetical protein
MPSAKTLRAHIIDHATSIEKLLLQDVIPGSNVSIALDCWSSPNRTAFMGITVYWIDKYWEYREALIGFEHLQGVHSGTQLAQVLFDVLSRHQIEHSVHTITSDNASNNDTLMTEVNELANVLSSNTSQGSTQLFSNKIIRIPCISHIIQLCLRELLGSIRIDPTNEELARNWHKCDFQEFENIREQEHNNSIPWTLAKVRHIYIIVIFILIRHRFENFQYLSTPVHNDEKNSSKSRKITLVTLNNQKKSYN